MKNKIRYMLWSGLSCVGICHIIAIIFSLSIKDGSFHTVSQLAVEMYGDPISADILQTIVCFIFGVAYSVAGLIYQNENRSLIKATLLHFAITMPITLIGAHVAGWLRPRPLNIISFIGNFIIIYVVIWIANHNIWKRCSKKINRRIQNGRNH